jgi:arginine decarboxylase
MQNSY